MSRNMKSLPSLVAACALLAAVVDGAATGSAAAAPPPPRTVEPAGAPAGPSSPPPPPRPPPPCPSVCRCAYLTSAVSKRSLFTTDCSGRRLESIPSEIPLATEALSLRDNALKDIHEHLPSLSNLQELDLSGNRIKSLGRGVLFQNMSSLRYLNLGRNDLSTLFSDSFSGLEQLEVLTLSENKINYMEDRTFGMLENLRRLSLDSNMIGSLYEEWFLGLKALVNLSIAHNIIHHINRNVFRAASELRELILTGNRINGIEPLGFNGLEKLDTLSVDGNLLAAVPTSSLQALPNLRYLKMDLNPIRKLQAYSFSDIKAQEVSLHNLHDLRIVDGFAFHNMFNMTVLRLNDNEKLSFIDPEAFANATALKKLYLHNNNLRGVSKRIIENLPPDVEIRLDGNPLLCDCNMRWIRQEMMKPKSEYRVNFKEDNHIICDLPPENREKVIKNMENRNIPKECAPTIIDFSSNRTLTRKLGDPLTMECRALGIPLPKLHWVLPDGTVLNSTSNSVRVRLRNPGTLIFYHLKATDSGRYTCVAENTIGSDNLSVTLKVTGIDIHLFPTGVSSTFVTLVWNGTARNAFPSYQILYQLIGGSSSESKWSDDQVSVSSFGRSHTINNLIPDTWYKFCITFEDKQGFYINISCTTAKTQDAKFMLQGIQRTSNVAVGLVLGILATSFIAVICLVTLAARKYRQRFYENPDKNSVMSNIPLNNLYSPLMGS
ncbi:leucine-rich repeat neuronal protein 1-like [Ischnura elegans]|uniref:leucine-rich repeat neuronal protein 1-like n=1 Tax=Ischnura elegans TaxID=197161 RepID=UPI001ED88BF8|nr:leucine-rich repeat neuronal protein 1-like [Ischnura elegans]